MQTPTASSPQATDGQLLRAFVDRRDPQAFARLVERHARMVLATCRSVIHCAADAEDAGQAAFMALARRAESIRNAEAVGAWLHRAAVYAAKCANAAAAIRQRHEQEAAAMPCVNSRDPNESGLRDRLHVELNRLPEKYRAAMILHHVEGYTQEQTAQMLACSVNAVAVRMTRGLEMLRKRLVRRGSTVTTVGLVAALSASASASLPPSFVAATSGTSSSTEVLTAPRPCPSPLPTCPCH
jgi:RNA polymerase sigma factor (sigma-70 family)